MKQELMDILITMNDLARGVSKLLPQVKVKNQKLVQEAYLSLSKSLIYLRSLQDKEK